MAVKLYSSLSKNSKHNYLFLSWESTTVPLFFPYLFDHCFCRQFLCLYNLIREVPLTVGQTDCQNFSHYQNSRKWTQKIKKNISPITWPINFLLYKELHYYNVSIIDSYKIWKKWKRINCSLFELLWDAVSRCVSISKHCCIRSLSIKVFLILNKKVRWWC